MRRKSTRNAQKPTPEKSAKETDTASKTRRSKRRKKSPSKSSDSEEEVVAKRPEPEATPDTTTKSHTPTDEETSEEPVWKVTSSEDATRGEIQKLKICLTRPSPDSPDKSKSRRSKSNSQTEDDATSSEDKSSTTRRTRSRGSPFVRNDGLSSQEGDEDVEEKKGKGKSKGKHKSKIEKSPHLSEPEIQTNNEISENVQVTPQSPSIDNPVDNENDYKVDVDDIQNANEKQGNVGEDSAGGVAHNDQDSSDNAKNVSQDDTHKATPQDKESDDDEPLSVIQKIVNDQKQESVPENVAKNVEPTVTEVVATAEEPPEKVEVAAQEESELQAPEQVESEKSEQTSDTQELQTEQVSEPTPEPPPPARAENVEEIEEKTTLMQEDVTEPEPQQNIAEDTKQQDVEENRSTDDSETKQRRSSDEVVSEPQVSLPAETSAEASLATVNVTEEKQSDNEQSSRRRLKRNNESANLDSKEDGEASGHVTPSKGKRKWEGGSHLTSSLVKFDLESFQVMWPSIDFPEEPDLNLECERERRKSVAEPPSAKKLERKVSVDYKSDSSEKPTYEKQSSVSSVTLDSEDNSNIIAFNRKISIVDDTASKLKPPPSPAKNPVSSVLYITNLVRPFTLKQLKELLERTGKIREEGFWTDRIKSKCYVQYETEEEAEATRNALHGVQWPIGNGKKLIIDYATAEDLKNAKNPPAPPAVPIPDTKASVKENLEPVENKPRNEEKVAKEAEKKRAEGPVREWDIGKKDVRRERSRSRERSRKHRRSPTPSDDFISRKQRKAEESVPQKLMDDLFLKTKATPSIYWQPLSPEEISMKQQQRLIRMEEHKRRMEENSRLKGRDIGRGAFRRRYD
ncbi:apoptotic chromatin condensation inducer in the nucleus [Asbolus verrucosus]|uniref:Apoptotic chromatin condensation inducer in the nucleus n=1 Tax=Asbolus verrucosus TaxID=1661398 RepID=A0A482W7E9_ASBVE|nr:apoptotic chromatin condensation inducer in the nucleus [Asbolus verrucosus]